jgi:ATP-binding cassette subfamily B protein
VRLDGLDVRTLALHDLRSRIGFVPQDSVLFAGTLRDNLLYGAPDADQDQIREALQLAHADGFVEALPDGLDTLVGEGGTGLSGGQKQRLAIARALLAQPRILLLDEATSALDAESEERIRNSIEALKGRCTILVIAHRLSTVRQADRILVLDNGSLVGSGNHDSLLRSSDLYARFARIQFASELSENNPSWRSTAG